MDMTQLKVTVVKGISTPYHELNMFKLLFILAHAFACGKPMTAEEILSELPEKYTLNNRDDMLRCIAILDERRALLVTTNQDTQVKSYILKENLNIDIYLNSMRI